MLYPLFSDERVLRFGLHLSLGIKRPLHQGIQRHYTYNDEYGLRTKLLLYLPVVIRE